jgi:DNA-directed RNA polymerase specialized sigma24 family protein
MGPQQIEVLYDAHAPRLYALALRITGGDADAAAAALEEAFVRLSEFADEQGEDQFRILVRLTRDAALTRTQVQNAASAVSIKGATPASLVEELFFGGLTLRELAGRTGLEETELRRMIHEGMAALRVQVARRERHD